MKHYPSCVVCTSGQHASLRFAFFFSPKYLKQFTGPHYDTPAEAQYAKRIGADLVGMSTALEAIAARHAGMEVFGISLVTNLDAGISPVPLSHKEVIEAGQAAGPRISRLLADIIAKL